MPLYDVTHPKHTLVRPKDAEAYEKIQRAKHILSAKAFYRCADIMDEAIEKAVRIATQANRLAFTKAGILVGRNPVADEADAKYIWLCAEEVYNSDGKTQRDRNHAAEMQLKLVGGFTRWRISLRGERYWLTYKTDTDTYNPNTGELITVSNYFVNDKYVPPMPPPKRKGFGVNDLRAKFGGSV